MTYVFDLISAAVSTPGGACVLGLVLGLALGWTLGLIWFVNSGWEVRSQN